MKSLRERCLRHVAGLCPAQAFVPQIDRLRFVVIASVILYNIQGYVFVLPLVLVTCFVPYLRIEGPFMICRPGSNRLVDAYKMQPA